MNKDKKRIIKRMTTRLVFISLLLIVSIAPIQGFAQPVVTAMESMPGESPVPLIAVPEDFFFRAVPSSERISLLAQLSSFNINYISGGENYWGDTCIPWPPEAINAFNYAANEWATYVQSSVPIAINACWATNLDSGVLGHSGPRGFYANFPGAPVANTLFPVALANALHGSDINPSTPDMEIAYSSSFNWYFGTDGQPDSGQYDFVSVVMHEMAHGLGFLGSMTVSSGQGSWGLGPSYPVVYDLFTENGSGQSLINTSLFPNPSAALGSQLTSNNVYFDGPNANGANGDSRPKLYTPGTWRSGSSYSHLDEIYNGSANALMTYSVGSAEAIHVPGPITLGILRDVGWITSSGEEKTPLNDTAEFVRQQYRDFLNREADSAGLQFWVNLINSGTMTKAEVIESFFWSQEFGLKIAPIVRLYFAYFLRIPDYNGLMFWINSGWPLEAISDFFAGSPEFLSTYGSLNDDQFVNLVYQNILGRLPDPGGYAFWVGQLETGVMTRGQVMVGFSESEEYKTRSSSEIYVTMMYMGMLRRAPDQGGFDFWVQYLDGGNSGLALINGFLYSQEYAARFQ